MTLLRLALKGIKANPLRLLLTGLAVVIGVSFVASSFIISDSLKVLFGQLAADSASGFDAEVRPVSEEFGLSEPMSDSVVDDIEALPESAEVTPFVTINDQFNPYVALKDGKEVLPVGPPVVVFSWEGPSDGDSLILEEGRPSSSISEVVLDENYVAALGASVGDQIDFNTPDGAKTFELTGVVSFEASLGAYLVLFDFESAQTLFDREGEADGVQVVSAAGVSESELVAAIEPILDDNLEVVGQTVVEDESRDTFNSIINIFKYILLGFALIALFVSLFIIMNTFAILVTQRTREFGLLRAVGATSSQIMKSVLIEALLVGLIASLIGLGGGVIVASGIKALLSATGGFPDTGTVITLWTVLIAFGAGVGATLISVIIPARSASSISPIAAMRNESSQKASLKVRIALGSFITGAGLIVLGLGLFVLSGTVPVITAIAIGAILTFLGVAAMSVLFAGPVVEVIGSTIGRKAITVGLVVGGLALVLVSITNILDGSYLSVASALVGLISAVAGIFLASNAFSNNQLAGHLAQQNAARSPRRTAATATALMIGLALVTMVSVMGESLKSSFLSAADNSIHADVFVFNEAADGSGGVPRDLADQLESIDGVTGLARFRPGVVRLDGEDVLRLAGFQSESGNDLIDFETSVGSPTTLDDQSMLVFEATLANRGWGVGDTVDIEFEDGQFVPLTIRGTYGYNSVMNDPEILVDLSLHASHYPDEPDGFLAFNIADGVDQEAVVTQAKLASDEYSNITAVDQAEFRNTVISQVDGMLVFINAMLGLTLVVAALGIVNTIALSVTERTREIGLLRAVGMTRQQLARSVRWEAVIVCVFGALLGILLGTLFAYAAIKAIPSGVLTVVDIPLQTIGTIIMASAVIGVLAAMIPAFFAGRKNVLAAIASE